MRFSKFSILISSLIGIFFCLLVDSGSIFKIGLSSVFFALISGDDEHSSKPVPAYVWSALARRGSAHTKLQLHAHTVTLPPFGPGEAGVHLVAPLPQHFKTALSALNLTLPEVTSPARKRRWFRQQDKKSTSSQSSKSS